MEDQSYQWLVGTSISSRQVEERQGKNDRGGQSIVFILKRASGSFDRSQHRMGLFTRGVIIGCAPIFIRVRTFPHRSPVTTCISTMTDKSQRQKGGGKVIPALNIAINGLNIMKEATSTTPVNPVFGSVAILLTMIRVSSVLFRDEMHQAHTQ